MKQKIVNQGLKKNFILYKGHTGWKVKTRIFGSLVVTLSALTLAKGNGMIAAHAATAESTSTEQSAEVVNDSEKPSSQAILKTVTKATVNTQSEQKTTGDAASNTGDSEQPTSSKSQANSDTATQTGSKSAGNLDATAGEKQQPTSNNSQTGSNTAAKTGSESNGNSDADTSKVQQPTNPELQKPVTENDASAAKTPVAPKTKSEPVVKAESAENLGSNTSKLQQSTSPKLQQPVTENYALAKNTRMAVQAVAASTDGTADSSDQYPVLSQDSPTDIGVDNTEVHLTADQIADHFTATVVDRDGSDQDNNPTKNKHILPIGKDGSVDLTTNDSHTTYSSSGYGTSVTGHQVAHVSFEHEIDFTHNFSLSGALGIGTKTSGGADSVGVVFAPGDPAKATEGGSGGNLGIGGLANAFGFVFDEYPNPDKNDPSRDPYFGWRTTDSSKNLQSVASSSEWKLASAVTLNDRTTNPLNDFKMNYDAASQTLIVLLGGQTFTRTITDTSQGYSISVAASTGGSQNDYSARIDKFSYTPKTITLTDKLVDSADSGALLDQAAVKAVANIGDTVSVFSTQAAAARAVAAGLVDPNLISILPTDSAGNVYVIDGNQTPSSAGTPKEIDNSGVADNTYYTYTVQDGDDQVVTIPVRLAFKAKVTPVDSVTKQPIAGLDPVTVIAVDGQPTLVQIPGYTPTKVTLAAPKDGAKIADDQLPIDQGTTSTGTSSTTTDDTAAPISHYYSGTGKTVDGQTVTTGTVKAGTGQSIADNLDQQPLVDQNGQTITSGGKTISSSDYYWSTAGNAGATDSTDEANPQASDSLLLPTTSTLDYWETQATGNQTKADAYNKQAQQMYQKFMGITGLTQAQKDDAQALLDSVSETYTNISKANGTAKAAFEAAKTATAPTDIYNAGQNGYASLEAVQNLLVSFEADLTSLGAENKDAESSLATFKSWEEDYGSPIDFSLSGVSFGPDFWTGGTEQNVDFFSNPNYYAFYSIDDVDGDPVTPKAAGKYFFKLTDAGRAYLKSLNPNNDTIGLYVSSMLTINPVKTAATVDAATVEYGGGHAADGTVGTWPAFTGSLGNADADHTVSSADFEVVDKDGNVVDIKDLQANGDYTIRYKQSVQDELAKDKNYTFTSFGIAKLTVTPRKITVTAHGDSKNFGTADPLTLDLTNNSADGLVNGDTVASLGVTLHRATGEDAGTYGITMDPNSKLNSNYDITVNKGTFTIAQLPVTVQVKDLSKTYGDNDPQLELDDTLVDGHQLTADDFTLSRVAGETVGTYKISGSAVAKSNYNVTVKDGTFTIAKRAITIQINNLSKTYDGTVSTDPASTWQIISPEGLAKNDTLDSLNVSLQKQAGEDVGHYAITGTYDNANYDIKFVDGTFLINPRVVAVTVDSQEKTYGEADPTLTCHLPEGSTLAPGQELSDLVTLTREPGEDAGTYAINGASKSNNYTFEITPSKLTINKRAMVIQADIPHKVYGEADPQLTWQVSDSTPLLPKDSRADLQVALQRQSGENIGSYTISGTATAKNYDITVDDGTLLIDPRPVAVTVDNQEKVYGDANPELTWQVSAQTPLAKAQQPTDLQLYLSCGTARNVGKYVISGATTNANYAVTITNGILEVTKRPVTVIANSPTKAYGDADQPLTLKNGQSVVVNGDSEADLGVTLTRQTGESAKTYAITGSSKSQNYAVTVTSGALTINPKQITVTVVNQTINAGEQEPVNNVTVPDGALVNGDSLAGLNLRYSEPDGKEIGTYAINAVAQNPNYDVTVNAGQLRVLGHGVDSAGNVTITEKDPDGNVVQIDKQWADGSQTTYNYDPKTGERTVHEQKNGENIGQQNITPDAVVTLPDDENTVSVVTLDPETKQPTFEHYTTQKDVDDSHNATTTTKDSTGDVTKVIKDWHDGSTTTYTYDPKTGNRKVTEQNNGKTVSEKTIEPGNSNVTLPDGSDVETTIDAGQPGSQPMIEHYTTQKDVDKSNNVTTTTKNSTGDVTKVTKDWHDGSTTTYNYDPETGDRKVTDQKDGKTIAEQTIAPGDSNVTLPDGTDSKTTVDAGQPGSQPVIEHYTIQKNVDDSHNATTTTKDSIGNVTKVTKDWHDGSTTTYAYDPKTGDRKVTEQNDGKTVSEKTIEPGNSNVTLPDGSDVETTIDAGQPGAQPIFEHYTTQQDTDKSNNVTTTTKDSTGDVTKVIKNWHDGSTTTYIFDPNTNEGTVAEEKNGENLGYQTITPYSTRLTLPDGGNTTSVVTIDPKTKQPTIEHYTTQQDTDKSNNVTATTKDSTGDVTKVIKNWHDGSTTTYIFDPNTNEGTITEEKNGERTGYQTITPYSTQVTLPDGGNTTSVVTIDPETKQPTIEHYTTQKEADASNNVTTTTKDSTGDVTKVIKNWHDGSTTTYIHDPNTGERTVTEQKDGKTIAERALAPGDSNVTLPDGAGGETIVNVGQSGVQPTFEHYTTQQNTDESNNVTTTTKDSTGDVTKITKNWHDGSTTTYTYDPNTGERVVTEQKDGKTIVEQKFAPGASEVTLSDGAGGTIVVKIGASNTMPTITHYPASQIVTVDIPVATNKPTDNSEKTIKIIKQWPDGEIIYTYDPATAQRLICEIRNGHLVKQRTIAPGTTFVVLSDGKGGQILVQFDKSGTLPIFTRQAADAVNNRQSQPSVTANVDGGDSQKLVKTKHVQVQQQNNLPQTGQKNESFWAHLGELLLALLTVPVIFRRRH